MQISLPKKKSFPRAFDFQFFWRRNTPVVAYVRVDVVNCNHSIKSRIGLSATRRVLVEFTSLKCKLTESC